MKEARSREDSAGKVDHICAPKTARAPKVMGVATIEGSLGCSIWGSSYVPGALQLTGSPLNDVL